MSSHDYRDRQTGAGDSTGGTDEGRSETATGIRDCSGHRSGEFSLGRCEVSPGRTRDPALEEFKLPQKTIDRLAEAYRQAPQVNRARSRRAIESQDQSNIREYRYRPAYDDFGFNPVKSTRGKLSKMLRAQIQAILDREVKLGLKSSAESVEDWWEKKKERTRIERNKRRRLQRRSHA